jgi:hypothetical protein
MIRRTISATILLACTLGAAVAQPGPQGGAPREAIEACTGVSLEQACRFEGPRGELTGTCREVRDGSVACVQNQEPEHGRRDPPPEAFTACKGLSEDDTCSVETPRGTLGGTCREPRHASRQEGSLICVPASGAPR